MKSLILLSFAGITGRSTPQEPDYREDIKNTSVLELEASSPEAMHVNRMPATANTLQKRNREPTMKPGPDSFQH